MALPLVTSWTGCLAVDVGRYAGRIAVRQTGFRQMPGNLQSLGQSLDWRRGSHPVMG